MKMAQTHSPIKGKPFDPNETFSKIVKYYVDKKKYSVEKANQIAQKIVSGQINARKK